MLFAAGSLKNAIGDAIDDMCNDYADEIQEFFNRVVDVPMCSDMCPCADDAFTTGGYDSIPSVELQEFTRNDFTVSGDFSDNMFMTRSNLDDWLEASGSAAAGYSQLTRQILQYGGGNVAITNPWAHLYRIPPTVTTYKDCFFGMVGN